MHCQRQRSRERDTLLPRGTGGQTTAKRAPAALLCSPRTVCCLRQNTVRFFCLRQRAVQLFLPTAKHGTGPATHVLGSSGMPYKEAVVVGTECTVGLLFSSPCLCLITASQCIPLCRSASFPPPLPPPPPQPPLPHPTSRGCAQSPPPPPPRGGVTRQGVVLTDLQSLDDCQ